MNITEIRQLTEAELDECSGGEWNDPNYKFAGTVRAVLACTLGTSSGGFGKSLASRFRTDAGTQDRQTRSTTLRLKTEAGNPPGGTPARDSPIHSPTEISAAISAR